jgi:hypothetical protein
MCEKTFYASFVPQPAENYTFCLVMIFHCLALPLDIGLGKAHLCHPLIGMVSF